ncbi:MAG: acetyl-CoA carboxylase biotin carboxyl carrier protein [Pyrinomonadaceae bacterium]
MEPAKKMDDQESQKPGDSAQPETEVVIEPERARGRRRNRSAGTEASVNMEELRELIQLIRENEFTEFELEREGFRVRLRRGVDVYETGASGVSQSGEPGGPSSQGGTSSVGESKVTSGPVHPGAKAETAAAADPNLHIVPSPIVGTFYRAPSPSADPFVEIGNRVERDKTVLCVIEAMKLMNEILADTSGVVSEIYVENGQAVEYGQPLFGIKLQ